MLTLAPIEFLLYAGGSPFYAPKLKERGIDKLRSGDGDRRRGLVPKTRRLYTLMNFKQWLFEMVDNDVVLKTVNHTDKPFERFMALIRGNDEDQVYLRCVLSKRDSTGNFPNSYLCEGRLINNTVHVDKILLSPETRSKTKRGEEVVGYEDPSLLSDGTLLITEVYKSNRILTNLVSFNPKTKEVKTILRSEKAKHDLGLKHADMVKEAHVFDLNGKSYMFLEVGGTVVEGKGCSQIVIARYSGGKLGKIMPFLYPIPKTWLSEHTSTACAPIKLGDDYVFLFNGRDKKKWTVGFGLLNPLGHLYYLSPKPIIKSPSSSGWGGQRISFASDMTKKGNKFEIFYHCNDDFMCKTTFEAKDFCLPSP